MWRSLRFPCPAGLQPLAIVVTGASTGIGRAFALELHRRGCRVFAAVRSEQAAEELRAAASGRLAPLRLDVTDGGQIAAAAETVANSTGEAGLAGLVNNAGIVISGPWSLCPSTPGAANSSERARPGGGDAGLPAAAAEGRRPGRNISSVNGGLSAPYMAPYSASKFAVEAITDALASEVRTFGIHVAAVEPGPIDTPIWQKSLAVADRMARTSSRRRSGSMSRT